MEKTSALPAPHATTSHAKSKPAAMPAGGDAPINSFSGLLAAMDEGGVELPEPGQEVAVSAPAADTSEVEDPLMPMPAGLGTDVALSTLLPASASASASAPAPAPNPGLDTGVGAAGMLVALANPAATQAFPAAGLPQPAVALALSSALAPAPAPAVAAQLHAVLPAPSASLPRPVVGSPPFVNPMLGNAGAGRPANADLAEAAASGRLVAAGDNALKVAANTPLPESLGNLLAQMKVSGGNSPVAATGLPSEMATSTMDVSAFGAKSLRANALATDASKAAAALGTALAAGLEKRASQSTGVLQATEGALVDVAAATLINGVDAVPVNGRFAGEFRDEIPSRSTEKMAIGDALQSFSTRFDATTGTLDSAGATAAQEDVLSQQLQYWVNQKSQTAELTLDAGTSNPVEVSITLTGNEAQVVFRTDQMQTRQMLDANISELRELLRSQGLELAGVSVADAGGNGKSSNQADSQESKKGAPQVTAVPLAAPAAVQTRASIDGTRGRKLDVFA